jgi:DNA repair exonuclease SbcCD ATPase subunit
MILQSLTVQGFKSIGDKLEIEFPLSGRIAIIGHNECGKTTLLEALWCTLYGLQRGKGPDREDIITWGKEAATLKAKLIVGHDTLEIERRITRSGKHEATLRWTSPQGVRDLDKVEAIEEAILQVTGMDRKTFAELVYIRQKELDVLKGLAKSDRELMINKVMGIDVFDRSYSNLKEDKKTIDDELTTVHKGLDLIKRSRETYAGKVTRKREINEVDYPRLRIKKAEFQLQAADAENALKKQRELKEAYSNRSVYTSKANELKLLRGNQRLFSSIAYGALIAAVIAVGALFVIGWVAIFPASLLLIVAAVAYKKSRVSGIAARELRPQLNNMPPETDAKYQEVSDERLKELESAHNIAQEKLSKVDGDISALDRELSVIEIDIAGLGNVEEQFTKLDSRLKELETRVNLLERVGLELRETAVQLRKQVFPHARLVINRILPLITGTHYTDMQITEDFHFKTYSTEANDYKDSVVFSGGTQDQFLIALRLAFTQTILESRVKASRYALFMDECISSSDSLRRQGIFDMLDAMKNICPQIFIIAHEDISEFVEHHLILSKDANAFTKIRKVSWRV